LGKVTALGYTKNLLSKFHVEIPASRLVLTY